MDLVKNWERRAVCCDSPDLQTKQWPLVLKIVVLHKTSRLYFLDTPRLDDILWRENKDMKLLAVVLIISAKDNENSLSSLTS